jgi:hypothetical protein
MSGVSRGLPESVRDPADRNGSAHLNHRWGGAKGMSENDTEQCLDTLCQFDK